MGMFDAPEYPDWLQEKFAEGQKFTLEKLSIRGTVSSVPAGGPPRNVVIAQVDGVEYACTGVGFEQQANSVKADDLPAIVSIERIDLGNGKSVKRFMPR